MTWPTPVLRTPSRRLSAAAPNGREAFSQRACQAVAEETSHREGKNAQKVGGVAQEYAGGEGVEIGD